MRLANEIDHRLFEERKGPKIAFIDTISPPRVIDFCCSGEFFDSESPSFAIALVSSIELYTLEGHGSQRSLILQKTIPVHKKITAFAKISLESSYRSEARAKHGVMFTFEDCSIHVLVFSKDLQDFQVYTSYDDTYSPLNSHFPVAYRASPGHKIMNHTSESGEWLCVYLGENTLIHLSINSSNPAEIPSPRPVRNRYPLRSLFTFLNTEDAYIDLGGLVDIALHHGGHQLITIKDEYPGLQSITMFDVETYESPERFSEASFEPPKTLVKGRLKGYTKLQTVQDGCWAVGNVACTYFPFAKAKHLSVSTNIPNFDVLATVDLGQNVCLGFTSRTTGPNVFILHGSPGDKPKIKWIEVSLHNVMPMLATVFDDFLFVAGHNRSLLFRLVYDQSAFTNVELVPILEFSGLGSITDITALYKPKVDTDGLVMACTTTSGAYGGELTLLSSNIFPLKTKEYEDNAEKIPVAIWEVIFRKTQFVIISYLGRSLRTLKLNQLQVSADEMEIEQDKLEPELEEVLDDIFDLSKLSGEIIYAASSELQGFAVFVTRDTVRINFENPQLSQFYSQRDQIRKAKLVSGTEEHGDVLFVQYGDTMELISISSGNIYTNSVNLGSNDEINVPKTTLDDAFIFDAIFFNDDFYWIYAPLSVSTCGLFSSRGLLLKVHSIIDLRSDTVKDELVHSLLLKKYESSGELLVFLGYTNGIVEIWKLSHSSGTSSELKLEKSINLGPGPVGIFNGMGSHVLLHAECLAIADEQLHFRPLNISTPLPSWARGSSEEHILFPPSKYRGNPTDEEILSSGRSQKELYIAEGETNYLNTDVGAIIALSHGQTVIAKKGGLLFLNISETLSRLFKRSKELELSPYRIAEVHNGHIATLSRSVTSKSAVDGITPTTVYDVTVYDGNLKVLCNIDRELLSDIEPYGLSKYYYNGFVVSGQENRQKDIALKEKPLWKRYHSSNKKSEKDANHSYKDYPTGFKIAKSMTWQDRIFGKVKVFAEDEGKYIQRQDETIEGGPVMVVKNNGLKEILLTHGSKFHLFDIEKFPSLNAVRDSLKKEDKYGRSLHLQTPTLCIAADASDKNVVMADLCGGLIVIEIPARNGRYWKYTENIMVKDVSLLRRADDIEVNDGILVVDDEGLIVVLEKSSGTAAESPLVGRLNVRSSFRIADPINKICSNGGRSWNPVSRRGYSDFLTPQAILGGAYGGLYQFGWITTADEEESIKLIDMLKAVQYNLKRIAGLNSFMLGDDEYRPIDSQGADNIEIIDYGKYQEEMKTGCINGEVLKEYFKLNADERRLVVEGDSHMMKASGSTQSEVERILHGLLSASSL